MLKADVDIKEVEERLAAMLKNYEAFPAKMATEMNKWQTDELHRDTPEIDRPTPKSVRVRKRGRGQHPYRAFRRLGRRIGRRFTPRPIRTLRRFARIGRRPSRVLIPAPIRRLRRFERQMRRVAGGRRTAVERALGLSRYRRMVRRARLNAQLWEALLLQMRELARNELQPK